MPKYIPIVTEIGTLRGRDAIHLDTVEISDACRDTLTLCGDFNCALASKRSEEVWQAYQIRFSGMLAMQMTELEAWRPVPEGSWPETAFDEVVDSPWMARMGAQASSEHRHFIFRTYDRVFEVICVTFELELKEIHY